MTSTRHYYKLLNLARLYCAVLIVRIHMGFNGDTAIVPCLTRQGVPFFFLISGFFFAKTIKKSKDVRNRTKRYVMSLLPIYAVWSIIFTPVIMNEYRQLYAGNWIMLILVLIRRYFFAGLAQYWYILILAEGAVFLAYIIKHDKWTVGLVLSLLGILLATIYNYQAIYDQNGIIYRLFYTVFSWNNNVVMAGFPLMYTGALIERYESCLKKKYTFWRILFIYLISIAAAFISFHYYKTLVGILPFGAIQGILLFLVCISQNRFEEEIPESICNYTRNLSSVMYLTHTLFLILLGYGLNLWDTGFRLIATIILSMIVLWIVRKTNVGVIKKLFMVK